MNRGPRTGVTGAVSHSDLDVSQGGWGVNWSQGSCALDLGSGIGGGGGGVKYLLCYQIFVGKTAGF